ncbi:MAG: tryptophan-rich sensory protein [candidate division Zixibacteria bacterium]|nr:tryptophan-rich sensory protein [candidate division Zixibacteria bacterium]
MTRHLETVQTSPAGQIIALLAWVGLCFLTAWIGSRFSPGEWYLQIQKPSWTPPGYLFGPVWSLLYLSMGVAAWLAWRRAGFSGASLALTLFVVQLILNGAWSWIFFGMHEPGLAFAEILVLWGTILVTMLAFWRVIPTAGILFIPYLAWVSFAAILNYSIWQLNKSG